MNIPRAAKRDKHGAKCALVMALWNEAVAAGGMVTPGLGKLVKIVAPPSGGPITVTDEHGVSKEYADTLRSLYEQLTGASGDTLDKAVET